MKDELFTQMLRYFDSEMSEAERKAFEGLIDQNQELSDHVASYKQMQSVAESVAQKISSRYLVTDDEKSKNAELLTSIQRARRQWKVDELLNRVYTEYFELDNPPERRPESLDDAFDYYVMEEYGDAIKAFENIDTDDLLVTRGTEDDKKLTAFYKFYYEGLSYMAESDFAEAISRLENAVTQGPDDYLRSKAQWFLALAYVKVHDAEKARLILKVLGENDGALEYKEKAVKMMNGLKKD